MKKLLIILLFASFAAFGQESKHFTLGYKDNGIVFGNAERCNGIQINPFENTKRSITNGINFNVLHMGYDETDVNGIYTGLLSALGGYVNGLALSSVLTHVEKMNGIAFSRLFATGIKTNGIVIGGCHAIGGDMNG